mmetsp:Transcript_37701/g.82816  ORF Transcript_37701/g.82816 Transcript_37701/m.82816 type:complete len:1020 (-) Transcript_37701:144-3203(-)
MATCGKHRRERIHMTGVSNRSKGAVQTDGPIDFDATMRSTLPQEFRYNIDLQLPATKEGMGNQDFAPKLPGHDYRQPGADKLATMHVKREIKAQQTVEELERTAKAPLQMTAPARGRIPQSSIEAVRDVPKPAGHKRAPRWNPKKWYEAPHFERGPLQREEGQTWNHVESQKLGGGIKGQDSLMRSVRRPEDVDETVSLAGRPHPINSDKEEYYPGRELIDAAGDDPSNDFQVRPVHLPDFARPPPPGSDPMMRMGRMRHVLRQRFAGRPKLMNVFRNCALTKPGYVFPNDLQKILDQLGIMASVEECDVLVKAVDKDSKGAVTFEEFSDLIYGQAIEVGGASHEAQERAVHHVTKTLMDSLIVAGPRLGKAFCEIDPERNYEISKPQFANALGTACNHVSGQAVEFLWAAQFPGHQPQDVEGRCIDWRSFMSQLAHFAHSNRAPTPCCLQGRKRQYDLLQRTAPLTGGQLQDLDLNRPDQNNDDEVHIVADKLVHRETRLASKPRDAAFLTEHYVEVLRSKAERCEGALPKRIPQARFRELLKDRDVVHQDELVELIAKELEEPHKQQSLKRKEPLYATSSSALNRGQESGGEGRPESIQERTSQSEVLGSFGGPAHLKIGRADIEAFVATQHSNRDHEVEVEKLLANVYRPPDEKHVIDTVNDGLNRQRRGNRPPRERPPRGEAVPYQNYWQARHLMEQVNDAISQVENSAGGKIKPSKVFQRLDMDGDGYISLSDLHAACSRYKIQGNAADLHAMFSQLDRADKGSVDVGEFTRNYEVHMGSLLDQMQRPIKAVYHEGGVQFGGPLQETIDAEEAACVRGHDLELSEAASQRADRSASAPPSGAASDRAGSSRSQISRAGASIASTPVIYEMRGQGRVTDVIRARYSQWKPHKSELYTSLPRTRYGMTSYPDTRHVTEAIPHLSSYHLPEEERFKTTNGVMSIFSAPDHRHAQTEDTIKKHARNEFRVERIRNRQRELGERHQAAADAANEFDELKVARKALNTLNYERRLQMACA